mgnify:CR=1 FL=1
MEYTSFIYVIFLAICGILYYVLPKKMQWIVLLIASLAFYVSIAQILVLYMLATTLIVYLSAMAIQRHKDDFKSKKSALDKAERKALKEKTKAKQKRILTATVVVTIGVLAALKYCNFFGSIVNGTCSGVQNRFAARNFILHAYVRQLHSRCLSRHNKGRKKLFSPAPFCVIFSAYYGGSVRQI